MSSVLECECSLLSRPIDQHLRGERYRDDQPRDSRRAMPGCNQHAGDRAEQDRDKGAGFDQRIADLLTEFVPLRLGWPARIAGTHASTCSG